MSNKGQSLRCLAGLALLAFSASVAAPTAIAQVPRPSISRIGKAGPITVYHPGDEMFESMLGTYFPGVDGQPGYEQMRPQLLILENNTDLGVRAYAVRWTITKRGGSVDHHLGAFITTRLTYRGGYSIPPGGVRLVGPTFSIDSMAFKKRPDGPRGFYEFNKPMQYGPDSTYEAAVDGVVYVNDTFWGPNKTQILQRYLCARNAEHDEAVAILAQLRGLPSAFPWTVSSILKADVDRGNSDNGRDLPAIYVRQRGKAAGRLNAILQRDGLPELKTILSSLSSKVRPFNRYTFMNAWDPPSGGEHAEAPGPGN